MADESDFPRHTEDVDEAKLGHWARSLNTTPAELKGAIDRDPRLLEQLQQLLGAASPARAKSPDPLGHQDP